MATRRPYVTFRPTEMLAGILAAAAILAGCEGSATQTTTGSGLSGTLVGEDGRPAAGAEVAAWRSQSLSPIGPGSIPAAMTRTDAQGRYLLDLEAGTYNVFARDSGEARAAGNPGVEFAAAGLDLGESTLMPPGSVSGRVTVGGSPAGEVFCFIPGSAFVAMTDTAGEYSLAQVPPGRYPLRYVGTGLAAVVDSVTVFPDSALRTHRPPPGQGRSLQPPAPGGLSSFFIHTIRHAHRKKTPAAHAKIAGLPACAPLATAHTTRLFSSSCRLQVWPHLTHTEAERSSRRDSGVRT